MAYTRTLLNAQASSSFVPITPCRVIDTRGAISSFGGPSFQAGTSRDFPIASASCALPANAAAYSINITVVPVGTLGYIAIWPTGQVRPIVSNVLYSSAYIASAAIVPAGTNGSISIFASSPADVVIDVNGYFLYPSDSANQSTALGTGASNAGSQNTAMGFDALQINAGNNNSAVGSSALSQNTTGANNVATGTAALNFNATGSANTAIGASALLNNLIGNQNAAFGFSSLWSNTVGTSNTALGTDALFGNVTGSYNTGVGQEALSQDTQGAWNVAVGYQAGNQLTVGSYNIDIGNQGATNDTNTIRIGTLGNHTSTYIAGINGVNISSGLPVLINSNGQLGTAQSSERFKKDVASMGNASDAVMRLRPVTFRYKHPANQGEDPLQYGLIGEEVEKVLPDLVVHGRDGQVEGVQYHELPAMLLNELQKQSKEIQRLQDKVAALEAEMQQHQPRTEK